MRRTPLRRNSLILAIASPRAIRFFFFLCCLLVQHIRRCFRTAACASSAPRAPRPCSKPAKAFAKRFLQRHNIPTANYAVCSTAAEVEKAIEIFHPPIVVKADGLAAGKGVIICDSRHTAAEAAHGLFTGALLGRGRAAGRHRGVPEGRRGQLSLPQRRQARRAARSRAGPQAHRRGRHRP